VTDEAKADPRAIALNAYLERQQEHGFIIETRGALQAVIVKQHPLHFLLRWISRARAEKRLVVSVDQHGDITSLAAEPIRW
jgi:hypothetical protein